VVKLENMAFRCSLVSATKEWMSGSWAVHFKAAPLTATCSNVSEVGRDRSFLRRYSDSGCCSGILDCAVSGRRQDKGTKSRRSEAVTGRPSVRSWRRWCGRFAHGMLAVLQLEAASRMAMAAKVSTHRAGSNALEVRFLPPPLEHRGRGFFLRLELTLGIRREPSLSLWRAVLADRVHSRLTSPTLPYPAFEHIPAKHAPFGAGVACRYDGSSCAGR